ncbi:MAG: zinc ribbon domain-containing protein [Gemmatimonadales bacterium]
MPIYEYLCDTCHERFTHRSSMKGAQATPPRCPKCDSKAVRRIFTPFYAKTIRKS